LLSKYSNKQVPKGFTIVELLVAMAVAAVLFGLALPAFNTFIEQRAMTSRVNDFISAVNLARSEAVNRGGPVSIQAKAAWATDEWGGGYCVTVGTPGNCNAALRDFVGGDGATMNALGGLNGIGTLTFSGRGMLTLGAPGTIQICEAGVSRGREVAVNTVGRAAAVDLACP